MVLRRLSKGINFLQGKYYNFVRVETRLLTSNLFYAILPSVPGGKQIEPAIL